MNNTKQSEQEGEEYINHSYYNQLLLVFWMTNVFLDWAWSTAAVHIGYYESNPFTNWIAQYVGIDISLSFHALLILGLIMIISKLQEFDKITYWTFHAIACFMAAWWMMNNIISYTLLTAL